MKQLNRNRSKITPGNREELESWQDVPLCKTPYFSLLTILAEAVDESAGGVNCYMVIGTTSDKSAVSLTLNQNGDKDAVYEKSLVAAAEECIRWLETP